MRRRSPGVTSKGADASSAPGYGVRLDSGDLNEFMKTYLMGTGTAVTDPDDLD